MLEKSDTLFAAGAGLADGDLRTYLSGEICGIFVGAIAAHDLGGCGLDREGRCGMCFRLDGVPHLPSAPLYQIFHFSFIDGEESKN